MLGPGLPAARVVPLTGICSARRASRGAPVVKGEGTVHFASRFVPQLLGLGTRYGLLLGSAIKGTEST